MKSTRPLCAIFQRLGGIFLLVLLIATSVSAQEAAQPSKQKLIETLLTVVDQLEAEKYSEVEKYFQLPDEFEHKMFAQLLKRGVISRQGVKALDLGGEYGNAIGVLKKSKADEVAREFSASVDQCFAMKMKQGDQRCDVIAHWTGEGFKILDINGVGNMDPDSVKLTAQAPVESWPTGDKPTKELLIETLKVFLHNIQNRHYDALRPNVYVPKHFQMSRFSDSLERNELSQEGIKVLANLSDKNSFGKAAEVYPKLRAEALTKRVEVPVDECYGILAAIGEEQGEVLAHWIGDRYKLLRVDDVGKLPAALIAKAKSSEESAATTKTTDPSTTAPAVATPRPMKVQPPAASEVKPVVASEVKPVVAAATLPKYETDKSVVMANYPALAQAVAANPNDVSQRARFVQSLLVIGNTPKAWTESVAIYRLDPKNVEVVYAIDQSIEGLKKSGIFQVGVPQETIEALMGKPLKTADVDGTTRWEYPNWNVDFNDGRFIKLSRSAVAATTKPTETVTKTPEPKPAVAKRFSVKLISFEKRITALHLIRTEKDLSLKETIKLIETLPAVIYEGLPQAEAESTKTRYAQRGLVTEIVEEVESDEKPMATAASETVEDASKSNDAAETPTSFSVEMSSFGDNKIAVIKVVRALNKGMRLMEAKQLTDNVPSIVLQGVSREDATAAKEKLIAAGAVVVIK